MIDALDLARHAGWWRGCCPGDRRAAGVGVGTELAQLRPYEIGDDVRHIDAAATARTGQPHVRLHVPERAMTTWIVLDVSPSMAFGTARRLKADVAEGVVLVFGRLGVRRAGSVGLRRVRRRRAASASAARRQARDRRAAADARRGRRARRSAPADGLADALARVGRMARQPGLVVVDRRLPRSARMGAAARHRFASATRCSRSRSSIRARPSSRPLGTSRWSIPRAAPAIEVDTSSRRVRERFAELERERRDELARELRRLRIDHVTLGTDQDWLLALGRHLR